MSRTRNAAITAAFSYAQSGLAVVAGLVLFPITVRLVGAYDYGLWLATGEAVGFLLLLDPGVFAVLPWLIAEADGRGDLAAIRRHLVNGLAVGLGVAAVFALAGAGIWFLPSAEPILRGEDLDKVRLPVVVLVGLLAVAYPLRVFHALLSGVQDAAFYGVANVFQGALTIALTLGLVLNGYGLLGLALAAGLPSALTMLAVTVRAATRMPALFRAWPLPTLGGVGQLFGQGSGAWLSGLGVRLMLASNGIILAGVGHPEWATLLAATGKVGQVLQNICWIIPDSGLVGLAQLSGQGDRAGVRRTVQFIMHLHVLTSGAMMLGLLAFNPAFVRHWMGPELYAGHLVNVLLAANLFAAALVHGAITAVGAISHRLLVGLIGVGCGVLYCGLGIVLVEVRGIEGLVIAGLASNVLACLLPGLALMRKVHAYSYRELLADLLLPWLFRTAPFLVVAVVVGVALADRPVWEAGLAAAILAAVYLWSARTLLAAVPWPVRIQVWLTRFGLLPGYRGAPTEDPKADIDRQAVMDPVAK